MSSHSINLKIKSSIGDTSSAIDRMRPISEFQIHRLNSSHACAKILPNSPPFPFFRQELFVVSSKTTTTSSSLPSFFSREINFFSFRGVIQPSGKADEYIKHLSRILHKAGKPRTVKNRPDLLGLVCNKPLQDAMLLSL